MLSVKLSSRPWAWCVVLQAKRKVETWCVLILECSSKYINHNPLHIHMYVYIYNTSIQHQIKCYLTPLSTQKIWLGFSSFLAATSSDPQEEEDRGFNNVTVGIGSISSLDVPDEMPEALIRNHIVVGDWHTVAGWNPAKTHLGYKKPCK